jgi:hypothetical protein
MEYPNFRRYINLRLIWCVLAVFIAGCDADRSAQRTDTTLETSLIGDWHWRFIDVETQHEIHVRTTRRADRTWDEDAAEHVPGDARSTRRIYARAGTWLVSERVLKTHTTVIDGVPVGRNSRLAFQTYPIIEVDENQVSYHVSRENGRPGQWPRVIELPAPPPTPAATIVEHRVPQRTP